MSKAMLDIAGIVLAGGRSSRMGQNKALLSWQGKPMIEHMIDTLQQLGIKRILISGAIEGYDTIIDKRPFSGPAMALADIIGAYSEFKGFLCVPVDMPLLSPAMLRMLSDYPQGACFAGYPLPAYFPFSSDISPAESVNELAEKMGISRIPLLPHWENLMLNANTPQEWERAVGL